MYGGKGRNGLEEVRRMVKEITGSDLLELKLYRMPPACLLLYYPIELVRVIYHQAKLSVVVLQSN